MKVLIHTPDLATPGGKSNYIDILQRHLPDDVTLFIYGAKGRTESRFSRGRRLLRDYVRFRRVLSKNNFDLVHLNPSLNPKSYFRDAIFAWLAKQHCDKLVVFWHGWRHSFERRFVRRFRSFFANTYGKADCMIVLADEFGQVLKGYGYSGPVHNETTIVDETIFNLSISRSSDDARRDILFMSRIEAAKGIYETIDAFALVRRKFPNVRLRMAGTGAELDALRKYVERHEIDGVDFLGWINGEEKMRELHSAHTFVLASYYGEGMPCAILEAMASGMPVLTGRVGGIPDFFQDGKMGFFVAAKDSKDLAQKMEKLLGDRTLTQLIRSTNRSYAQERFRPEKVAKRISSIYATTRR